MRLFEGGLWKWHTLPHWLLVGKNLVASLHLGARGTGIYVSSSVILCLAKTSENFISKRKEEWILRGSLHSLP